MFQTQGLILEGRQW